MPASSPSIPYVIVFNHTENILKLIEVNLAAHGYRVSTYLASLIDVENVLNPVPDLIVLGYIHGMVDRQLGIVDLLRHDDRTRHVPIVICPTGPPGATDTALALSDGNIQIVEKPFGAGQLLAAVSTALA